MANVVADQDRTALELVGTAAPPVRFVRQLGGADQPHRQLVLRDDQGRSYVEIPAPGRTFPDQGGVHTEDAIFPPLVSGVRWITLDLPFVVVTEESGSATLTVPLAGTQAGDTIPLQADLPFGQEHLVVTGATIVTQQGERWVKLRLAPTDWQNGRKLVGPDRVLVDGQGSGFQAGFDPVDVGQRTSLAVPLPASAADQVTITFQYPDVAVAGPWHVVIPVPVH